MSAKEQEARAEIKRAFEGKLAATLADGIRWELLGLGRVFFENGKAIWYPADMGSR